MQRIIVVGPPGAGKSTVGSTIAERLGCRHIELDSLWWDSGWTEAGIEVFRSRIEAAIADDRWVVDGNYFSNGAHEVVWPRADTVVWLDLPRRVTFPRVVWRSSYRSLRGIELWNGNRETFRDVVATDSVVLFAWRNHASYGRRYEDLDREPSLAHLTWIRLRSPRAVRRWLATIERPTPGG